MGNNYIFLLYHVPSNAILVEPMKNRSAPEMIKAWTSLYHTLDKHGEKIQVQILDNECSGEMKQLFQSQGIAFQQVPPNIHRWNTAERAIRTFKNHLIAGLSSCDSAFPAPAWDLLLPQAQITLNLLRQSNTNPSVSAYQHLFGAFDFNRTPLAPPGIKVLVHEKPAQRTSFAPHGIEGYYVGPALHLNRCYTCYIPSTGKTRITDTVQFIPHQWHTYTKPLKTCCIYYKIQPNSSQASNTAHHSWTRIFASPKYSNVHAINQYHQHHRKILPHHRGWLQLHHHRGCPSVRHHHQSPQQMMQRTIRSNASQM